jgi:hypothetical protein
MEETAPDMADSEPDDPMGLGQVDDLSTGSENEGVLEESDTLEGGPTGDPLDTGIIPADKWSAGEGYGTTEAEEEAGESLDQLLSEEEPDIDPYAEAEREDEEADTEDEFLEDGDLPEPRAGRLVAEDEGAHPDEETDLVASDVGIDAGAAGAEEAAVHLTDGDEQNR